MKKGSSYDLEMIIYLLSLNYSLKDIEQFLNINLDAEFFKVNYPAFADLYGVLSVKHLLMIIYQLKCLNSLIFTTATQKFLYPTLLLLVNGALIIIFKKYFLSGLMSFSELSFMQLLPLNILYFCTLLFVLFCVVILGIVVLVFRNETYKAVLLTHKNGVSHQLRDYYNLIFLIFISFIYKDGIATKQLLYIFSCVNIRYIKSSMAFVLSDNLSSGESFLESITHMNLNKDFRVVLTNAVKSNDFETLVDSFISYKSKSIELLLKRVARYFLVMMYLVTGVTVAVLYQLIMMPISALISI